MSVIQDWALLHDIRVLIGPFLPDMNGLLGTAQHERDSSRLMKIPGCSRSSLKVGVSQAKIPD